MSGTTGVETRYCYLACLPACLVHFPNEQTFKKVMHSLIHLVLSACVVHL